MNYHLTLLAAPWIAVASIIIFIAAIYINRKAILGFLRIDRYALLLLSVVFGISLVIRLFVIGHSYLMWTDEAVYMDTARTFMQHLTTNGYSRSIGWPIILSISFLLFGLNNWIGIYLSSILGALTVVNVFFICNHFTRNRHASLAGAFIFSLFFSHLKWSGSAETNVPSLFFITLSIMFWFIYYEKRSFKTLILSLSSLLFAVQMRPENYLFILLFIVGAYNKEFFKMQQKPESVVAWFSFGLLALPNFLNNLMFSSTQLEARILARGRVFNGFIEFFAHLFSPGIRPSYIGFLAMVFILAMLGIPSLFRDRKKSVFLLAWFLTVYIIAGLFFEAHYLTHCTDRTYLNFFPVFAVLSSFGMSQLKIFFRRRGLIILISLLAFTLVYPSVQDLKRTPDFVLETGVSEIMERELQDGCVVFTSHSELLTATTNIRAYTLSEIDNVHNDCMMFYEGIYCLDNNTPEHFACMDMHERFNLKTNRTYEKEGISFTLYNIISAR